MDFALSGIRILDLSRVLVGPYTTMILGDLGADVIKIELPGLGDDSRSFPPYANTESAYFMSLNRNKRSMTLDLKSDDGRELFLDMVRQVDVVVENFRPGTMERLGIGYDVLRIINPRLIYAAASGFGHTGPYSRRAAYDGVVQAMGGIMSITGPEGGPPTRVGTSIGDIAAGLFAAIGILAAVVYRDRTGEGQKVDVAMLDCQVALLENAISRYTVAGEVPTPIGNRHPSIAPFEPFDTAAGQLMIAVGNDKLWCTFCKALCLEELAGDERFKTNADRIGHYGALRPLIAARLLEKTREEWRDILDEHGVPNGPINSVADVIRDPQVLARDMIVDVEHPVAGNTLLPGIPVKLDRTPGMIRRPAPLLGQHTEEILREEFGYSDEKIAAWRAGGIF
jgi:CoA:oxalate CoA-transferase